MFLRRKSSKRNPKPFRRYDVTYESSVSFFDMIVLLILIVLNCVIIYGIIRTIMI